MKTSTVSLTCCRVALFIFLVGSVAHAQNVGIGTSTPDPSAKLEIASDTSGLLIPRMDMWERITIAAPATGLLVYQTDGVDGFWFYNGTAWVNLNSQTTKLFDADEDTKIQVEKTADDDIIRFDMAGTEFFRMDNGRIEVHNTGRSIFIGIAAGNNDDLTTNENVFIGYESGRSNTTGEKNVAIGLETLGFNISGSDNTAIGYRALKRNTTGSKNFGLGTNALTDNTTGIENIAIGAFALLNTTTGQSNTAFGKGALATNKSGSNNTGVGHDADVADTSLTNATAIGARAYVSQSNSLVLGSISGVNGAPNNVNVGIGTSSPATKLHVVGNIKMEDGNEGAGKILVSDVTGVASWADAKSIKTDTLDIIADADADTKIQVEKTADDDIIHFAMAGTEFFRMDSGRIEVVNTGGSVFMGDGAGANDDFTDNGNVAVGDSALFHNIEGEDNVANGNQALFHNIDGEDNVANGRIALYSNTEGFHNVANGSRALYSNTSGAYNVATGSRALYLNTAGEGNVASGYNALDNNNNGDYNSAIGYGADVSSGNLTNATAIGAKAYVGQSNSLVLGSINGVNGATSDVKVGIGTTSPDSRLHVMGGIRIDGDRLEFVNTGNSVFIGDGAGINDDFSNNKNIGIGYQALSSNTTGNSNVANGYQALSSNTTGNSNVANGYQALKNNTEGNSNVAFGAETLLNNTTGGNNAAYGASALKLNTEGNSNVALGAATLNNNTEGSSNVATGLQALLNNTTGDNNVAVGRQALDFNTTGSGNTAIGYGADVTVNNLANATAIGASATVSQSNSLVLGNAANVGIGTSAPSSKLDLVGNIEISGSRLHVGTNGRVGIGTSAPDEELSVIGIVRAAYAATELEYVEIAHGGGNGFINTVGDGNLDFRHDGTTKMSLTDNGYLGIGTNAPGRALEVQDAVSGNSAYVVEIENTTNSNGSRNNGLLVTAGHNIFIPSGFSRLIEFERPDGTNLGEILQSGSNTVAYATTSDRRLKENTRPTRFGLGDLMNIEVRDYNYKTDDPANVQTGFIAQQLYTVYPQAVGVGGENATTDPWNVAYGSMTPILVQAVQEQQAIIDAQQAELEALQTKVNEVDALKAEIASIKAILGMETTSGANDE